MLRAIFRLGLLVLLASSSGCQVPGLALPLPLESTIVPTGNPRRGRDLMRTYGCISCHAVPDLSAVPSFVGPPLERWPERNYIAGQYANTPANLIAWLENPQALKPGTAMPYMGVTPQDAADLAAFLYHLEGEPVEWLDQDLPVEDQR